MSTKLFQMKVLETISFKSYIWILSLHIFWKSSFKLQNGIFFKVRHTLEMTLGQVFRKYCGNTNFKSNTWKFDFSPSGAQKLIFACTVQYNKYFCILTTTFYSFKAIFHLNFEKRLKKPWDFPGKGGYLLNQGLGNLGVFSEKSSWKKMYSLYQCFF